MASPGYTILLVEDNASNALLVRKMLEDSEKAFVHACPDGVDVLAPPGASDSPGAVEPDRIRHVFRFARSLYPRIVVDLGVLGPVSLNLLEDATQVILVASEELPSLWETARLLKRLTQLAIPAESVHLVLNFRIRRGGVPASDLEKALGHPVWASVAAAAEEQHEMLADGRFVDAKSPIRKDVVKIAAKLLGKGAPDQGGGFSLTRLVRG